jgi:nitrogen PTS system EIIA component
MTDFDRISARIEKGGVYYNISGVGSEEIFADLSRQVALPKGLSPEVLCAGLCERERLMTTAVGNGIAIPHPRTPSVGSVEDERLFVCYLDKPVPFGAMDGKSVYVLFVILSASSETHLKTMTALSFLLQKEAFRVILRKKPDTKELISAIKQHL